MRRSYAGYAITFIASGMLSACVHTGARPETGPRPQNVVTAEMIASASGDPIEKIIADRVAGVRLATASDGTLTLHIRGTTSWNGDNTPLYVIDGVEIPPGGAGLAGINPNDIEQIVVLKDGPSTTMYGSRGANGVILIKTKQP